jgi:hypothetical protein
MRGRHDTILILLGMATAKVTVHPRRPPAATDSTATGLYCAAGRHVAFGDPDFPP